MAMTPAVSAACHARDGTLLADLPDSFARRWQDQLNDTGSGSLSLLNTDAALASVAYGSVIRFKLDGTARFASLVERKARVSLDPGEGAEQVTTISGRGVLAIFEEAVVTPALGVDRPIFRDQRLFNFASPDFDDASWPAAVENPNADYGEPDAWPDPNAKWIWDRVGSTYDPVNGPPLGDIYARKTFSVSGRKVAELWGAADDAYEVWLDGMRLYDEAFDVGYLGQSRLEMVELDSGTHYLAVRARNMFPNRAGLRMTLLDVDTVTGATTGTVHARTDNTWKLTGYPADPPGFTPGKVIRLLVDEAQARGALTGVTLNFSDSLDSASQAWPTTPDISVQVGDDLLSVLRQMTEAYVDLRMAATSLQLSAYATRGSALAVTFTAGETLTSLHHDGQV